MLPCRGLVAQGREHLGRRTDPDQARLDHGASEAGVFREEAVAGVDGIGPHSRSGCEDLSVVQVALGGRGTTDGHGHVCGVHERKRRIGIGVHHRRANA